MRKHFLKISEIEDGKGGFTILYSLLITSLLLSIGVSIYTISLKQYQLASSAVDSQLALYAADSGIECAKYHWGRGAFGEPSYTHADGSLVPEVEGASSFECANQVFVEGNDIDEGEFVRTESVNPINGEDEIITEFKINLSQIEDPSGADTVGCAIVTVTNTVRTSHEGIKLRAVSRGYNYCEDNSRKVERALVILVPYDKILGQPID